MKLDESIQRAAAFIADAGALLIGAGAGMGVDSGLPDFRGDQGFWKAYPRYAELGLNFAELADPRWFKKIPIWPGGSTATVCTYTAPRFPTPALPCCAPGPKKCPRGRSSIPRTSMASFSAPESLPSEC